METSTKYFFINNIQMTKDNDRRIVNLRFVFCCFVGIMLGIVSSTFLLLNKLNVIIFVLSILLVIAVVVVGILYSFKISKTYINTKFKSKVPYLIKMSAIGFGVAFVIGIVIVIAPIMKVINLPTYNGSVVVSGVVCDYVDKEETYIQFLVKDCRVITSDSIDTTDMKIVVNSSVYTEVELGDYITFECELKEYSPSDSYGLTRLANGIGYSTYAKSSDIVTTSGKLELVDLVRSKVKTILDENLNSDNSEICYAILFGQKYGLSDSISDMFSYSGISHILAVSGLHIGVLVTLIWFILKKLKINDYLKLGVFAIVLLFYSYLCGFSPSVCRASIMAFVLAVTKVRCLEYDIINSLGFAGCVILICNPLTLYSVSFQLSFMCIFGIITFAPFVRKCLEKIKCPQVLVGAFAVSIAVNIVILPVAMNIFYKVSLLGILANILVLPIFSITYILLFIVVLLSMLINSFGVLLAVPEFFLHIIKTIAYYFNLIPFGVFKVFRVTYWLTFLVMLVTLTIHFLMVKHWWKYLYVSVLLVICTMLIVMGCIPKRYENDKLVIAQQYNSNVVVYTYEGQNVLIGSNIEVKSLDKLCRQYEIKEFDKVIAYDLQLNKLNNLYEIVENYSVNSIIIPSDFDYSAINNKLPNVEIIEEQYITNNLIVNLIRDSDDIIGIKVVKFDTKLLIPFIDNSKSENNELQEYYSDVDYVITDNYELWKEVGTQIIDITKNEKVFL